MPGNPISNSGALEDFIVENEHLQLIADEADLSCRHVHQMGKNHQFLVEEAIGNIAALKQVKLAQIEAAKNVS